MDECPYCHGEMIGVEYSYDSPYHYDGISEWDCLKCNKRFGRWSKKVLGENEYENCHWAKR